jgi:hypothetical protein
MNANMSHCSNFSRNVFRLFVSAIGLPAILLLSLPRAGADETNSNPAKYDIEIKDGGFSVSGNLTTYGADLRNVIEHLFRQRYPRASFILSPELLDVEIADLKLGNVQGAVDAIKTELEAIRVASGNKFTVKANWPTPGVPNSGVFLLEANPAASPSKNTKKIVEAFNLSALSRKFDAIQQQLDEAMMNLSLLQRQYGEKHPDVQAKTSQIAMLQGKLGEALEQEYAILNQIQTVVNETLGNLGLPGIKDFSYHKQMNLLVVIGSQEQIDVTRKVVNALLDKPPLPETTPPEPKPNPQP